MAGHNSDILKFRRKPKAAIFIFIIILIYIIAFTYIYLSKAKVRTYEVYAGSLTSNTIYTGLAVRSEEVFNSEYSGNINYYHRESIKAKNGDTIYTVDETGRVSQLLAQLNDDKNTLSNENLKEIKSTLNTFKVSYTGDNFNNVYNLKTDINAIVLEAINNNLISNLDSLISSTGSQNLFQTIKTPKSGIVVYSTDGYENFSEDKLDNNIFKKSSYDKKNLKGESIIVKNSPVYKLITNEAWNVYIPLTDSDIQRYELTGKKSVKIRFVKDNLITTPAFSIITKNGQKFGKLTFDRYMIRYVTDRFLDVELMASTDTGLKIPVSSLVEKDFYVIPKDFLTTGGNSNSYGFISEYYTQDNKLMTQFRETDIYCTFDGMCYVSTNDFKAGDNIIKQNSSERYLVGSKKPLTGVYCANTGYTSFRLVEITDRNDEYCIIKKDTKFGISVYDHIILDAEKIGENLMIY